MFLYGCVLYMLNKDSDNYLGYVIDPAVLQWYLDIADFSIGAHQ